MNFSMFGSVKSQHSDEKSVKKEDFAKNPSINFDDFLNKSSANPIRESIVSV